MTNVGQLTSLALVLASLGCGSSATGDGGLPMSDAAVDGGLDVAPPVAPAPPAATCPEGWRVVTDGAAHCVPFPGVHERCTGNAMHLPGRGGCEAVGAACGAPPVPAGVPAVWHVASGGTGDGTSARPFGRIADAVSAAADGDAIAIAPGVYDELLRLGRRVALVGACPDETVIETTLVSETEPIVDVTAAGVSIANLTIRGPRVGVRIAAGADATLTGVVLADLAEAALFVVGNVTLEDSLVAMFDPTSAGRFNTAMDLRGTGTIRRSELRGHAAMEAVIEGTATVEDSAIAQLSGGEGYGLVAVGGGELTVRRSAFDSLFDFGAWATDDGTVMRIEDSHFAEVTGNSVMAEGGGAVEVLRTSIDASWSTALATREGGQLLGEDLVVLSAGGGPEVGYGGFFPSGDATLRRTWIGDTTYAGISHGSGSLVLEDVEIVRTIGREDQDGDAVAILVNGGTLNAARVRIDTADIFGLLIVGGSVTATDVEIAGVTSSMVDARGGALWITGGATTSFERLIVRDTSGLGFGATAAGTTAILRHAAISGTGPALCGDERCGSFVGGVALGAYDGASVDVERFVLSDNELAGAQVAYGNVEGAPPVGGVVELRHGVVERNAIGVNVQVTGYDLERVTQTVTFRENERNVDSAELQVPTPPPLDW